MRDYFINNFEKENEKTASRGSIPFVQKSCALQTFGKHGTVV
jgi:hypothetical protein